MHLPPLVLTDRPPREGGSAGTPDPGRVDGSRVAEIGPAERGVGPVDLVDQLLVDIVRAAPCKVRAELGDDPLVTVWRHAWDDDEAAPVPLATCPREAWSAVLACVCWQLIEQVYFGCAHRHLILGDREVRVVAFASHDQLGGYWLRIHVSSPLG